MTAVQVETRVAYAPRYSDTQKLYKDRGKVELIEGPTKTLIPITVEPALPTLNDQNINNNNNIYTIIIIVNNTIIT